MVEQGVALVVLILAARGLEVVCLRCSAMPSSGSRSSNLSLWSAESVTMRVAPTRCLSVRGAARAMRFEGIPLVARRAGPPGITARGAREALRAHGSTAETRPASVQALARKRLSAGSRQSG